MNLGAFVPYLPLIALVLGSLMLALLIVLAPPDLRELMQGDLNETLRTLVSIIGPTALAALGDVAAHSKRPEFGRGEPKEMEWRYYAARYCSWPVFGVLSGAGTYFIVGPEGPLIIAWALAAAGGALGMGIINQLFNRALEHLPRPSTPADPTDEAGA